MEQELTLFQGFSAGWTDVHWAMELLCRLPADVLEASQPLEGVLVQRIGGERQLSWAPIDVSALEQLPAPGFGAFIVCFTGDVEVAERVDTWIGKQQFPIEHVSLTESNHGVDAESYSPSALRNYCQRAFEAQQYRFSIQQRSAFETAINAWQELALSPTDHTQHGHNIFLANQMTLRRAGKDAMAREPWIGRQEKQYTDEVIESAKVTLQLRNEVGVRGINRLFLPTPALILAEPALYRPLYKRPKHANTQEDKAAKNSIRLLQNQKGLCNESDGEFIKLLQEFPVASTILIERSKELKTFTLGVGLRAASMEAAVLRLSPGVNHVYTKLDNYARHIRKDRPTARLKSKRLFETIQKDLAKALGEERIKLIEGEAGPIKLVTDSPMEWLKIDGLPLSLARDCSRINATPGNVAMAELAKTQAVNLMPEALTRPLVLSSFAEDDPLKDVVRDGLQVIKNSAGQTIAHDFRRVYSVDEFVDTLNAYNGAILVVDAHGYANSEEPIGGIVIGGEKLDVWHLRNKVRVPPIVILSACDTHSADAGTHATVGNGFLVLGATTVLATMLPIGGLGAAMFIARFIFRLEEFLPAALSAMQRALSWTEVVSGMLRMTLVSEVLDEVVGLPYAEARATEEMHKLQTRANMWINCRDDDWYDRFLCELACLQDTDEEKLRSRASRVIARSESIRYVQLGNPEIIRIINEEMWESLPLND